jgi:uncharacterized protein (DUF983 family)
MTEQREAAQKSDPPRRGCCPNCGKRISLYQSTLAFRELECRGCGYGIDRGLAGSFVAIPAVLLVNRLFSGYGFATWQPWVATVILALICGLWPMYFARVTPSHHSSSE